MKSLHLAILIFVVGASVVNFFYAKQQYDWYYIDPSEVVPTVVEGPETSTEQPEWAARLLREHQKRDAWRMSHRNIENVYDAAYMWEAAIITLAGIVYVLAPRRPL